MDLSKTFAEIFPSQERAFATIVGERGVNKAVAQTPAGSTVILTGTMEVGKNCFYDRRTSTIIEPAPNVEFTEFGI